MTRPLPSNAILCKDGASFFVDARGSGCVLFAEFRDEAIASSGLGNYGSFHEPGDPTAEYEGMPVEVVRGYARAHGGVAEAGATALALLQRLPTAAALSDAKPGAREVAPSAGFRPDAGGSRVAGRPASEAPAGASHQRHAGGSGAVEVDTLTPAVIEARKLVEEFDGPFLHKGREPATDEEARHEWERRCILSCRVGRLFPDLTDDRFARPPLRDEAIAVRERLTREIVSALPHLNTARREARAG